MEYLFLILLGIITYFIIQRSVNRITRTPVWLLWLVMMTPALSWVGWTLIYGSDSNIPWQLLAGPFLLCPMLYWLLIQWGRITPENQASKSSASSSKANSESPEGEDKESSPVRPITPSEEKLLRNCFPWEIYYLQNLDYRPQAILCRGKLRSNPGVAYHAVESKVKEKFGDRFFVIFQEGFRDQPFFALVPNPRFQAKSSAPSDSPKQISFAIGLFIITFVITTIIGMEVAGYSLEEAFNDPQLIQAGFAYSLPLIAVLSFRELIHYLTAVRHRVSTALPYFVPLPFFPGTIGGFIQKRSPIPNRRILFDLAISGPIAGLLVTIPVLIWGLSLSEVVDINEESRLLSLEALNPRFSFLLALLSKLALGSQLSSQNAIDLHPVAVAGYIGLGLTALNLIPIGQLDGGQIIHAVFGQRTAIGIAQFTRLLMLIIAWIQPDFWILAIILLLMPIIDEPALNDVTQLDDSRDVFGLLSLAMLLFIILPLPGSVAQWLNF